MEQDRSARVVGDRYEVLSEIGRGGSGVVWRARDQVLGRTVALKEVRLTAALQGEDPERSRSRVLREARAAARLNHPAVTAIYDVLDTEGTVFLVMELVDAPSLSALVGRSGPLAAAKAARIGLDVLGALEAAHEQGIVHRDVKPGNVMVRDDGPAKLTDFGIAALIGDSGVTMTGALVGSPAYMAPEQANGVGVDTATDLWALGATLAYAVAGEAPFDRGQPLATLNAVVHDPLPESWRGGALGPAITQLLAKDPAQRPTVDEARRLLEEVLGHRGAATAVTQRLEAPAPAAAAAPAAPAHAEPRAEPRPVQPPPARSRPTPSERSERRSALVPVLVVVLLLAVTGVVVATQLGGDQDTAAPAGPVTDAEPDDSDTGQDETADDAEAADDPEPDAQDAAVPDEDTDEQDTSPADAEAPQGWTRSEIGPAGASVEHPQQWQARRQSTTIVDYVDPSASGTYLRTDWTDAPREDPEADWRNQSASFAQRHEGYEEIRIEPMTLDGHPAAIWEYRYRSGGAELRAINVGINAGDHGYALNFQTSQDRWGDSAAIREQILASFRS